MSVQGDYELVEANSEYFTKLRAQYQKDCKLYKKSIECYQLAEFYEMRDKNYGAAAGLYSWLCDSRKHATSCVKMGMLELSARAAATQAQMSPDGIVIGDAGAGAAVGAAGAATAGSKRLAPNGCRALERFKQACELGEPAGCHNAGLVLKTGRDGAVKDVGKAVEYFDKACNGNDPWGCFYMGLMTANVKNDPALTTDKPRALAYWSKACNIGTTTPCVWGCRNAHVMLQNGDGVPKDVEKAAELKARALQIIEASK
eukprot:gene2264-11706_t